MQGSGQENSGSGHSIDPVHGEIDRELFENLFDKLNAEGNPFMRRTVSDNIFSTLEVTRSELVQTIPNAGLISIPTGDETTDAEVEDIIEVPATTAAALIATAQVALDWRKYESDPGSAAIEKAHALIQEVPPLSEGRISVQDLYSQNLMWGALFPLSTENPHLVELLDMPLPKKILSSSGRFSVEAQQNQEPFRKIAAIIRGTLLRLNELGGSSVMSLREQMKTWPQWQNKILPASTTDADSVLSFYKGVMVPPSRLEQLASPMQSRKQQAQEWIRDNGGFLHEPNEEYIQWMLKEADTTLVCTDPHDRSTAFGYSSVMSSPEGVKKFMADYCGYDPQRTEMYSEEFLPKTSGTGRVLDWFKKSEAAQLLNAMKNDELAISVEIAIAKSDPATKQMLPVRYMGAATALKRDAYTRLIEEGKTMILLQYFEIVAINGQQINGVSNGPSRQFIEALGGRLVGGAYEDFESMGFKLKVFWHYWVTDLSEAVQTIEK